jgi:ketosteroid isomerase-like protein
MRQILGRAMPPENVELVRQITDAFNRGDVEGALAPADPPPEFEFVPSGVLIPDLAEVPRGPQGMRRLVDGFLRAFDDLHVEIHELIDAGDQVFAWSTIRGRGTRSGVTASWDVWGVYTVRDGRVVRWLGFTDRDAALEAAGLGE